MTRPWTLTTVVGLLLMTPTAAADPGDPITCLPETGEAEGPIVFENRPNGLWVFVGIPNPKDNATSDVFSYTGAWAPVVCTDLIPPGNGEPDP